MIAFMFLLFGLLLFLSTPIAIVLLTVTATTLHFFLGIPLQAVVQQLNCKTSRGVLVASI